MHFLNNKTLFKKWNKQQMGCFRSCAVGEVNESGIKDGCRGGGGSVGVGKGVVFVFSIGYVMLIEDGLERLAFTVGMVTTGRCNLERF